MQSRNQYLLEVRDEYLKTTSKKRKGRLLDEAEKRTGLRRKYLIRKLKPKSNLDREPGERKRRKEYYDGSVRKALARCWEIFDYPCGQRLEPLLKREVMRLRALGELVCCDEAAGKLQKIDFSTIDEKLKHEKEVRRIKGNYHKKHHPLLYQKILVKVFSEQDRAKEGTIQLDLVEHCGQSARGEYINTLASTDNAVGWWEGEAVMGKSQVKVSEGLKETRMRFPFLWKDIHSDGGTEFINDHLWRYTQEEKIGFSRSRPYKKNDNCLVEQKNWTHVRKIVGYYRYDTLKEQDILNDLYRNELRLFKNFFQPVMKLQSKERIRGRIKRRYDIPKTPYQRVMESPTVSLKTKQELTTLYHSLNPAQLKRTINTKLTLLSQVYHAKYEQSQKVELSKKKLTPRTVTFLIPQPEPISVTYPELRNAS
ncbi:MAG: transposase [Candidatus Portnoybacteria bacterium]|nr:transposase [Candidatus Portnoybacteria bacterium]